MSQSTHTSWSPVCVFVCTHPGMSQTGWKAQLFLFFRWNEIQLNCPPTMVKCDFGYSRDIRAFFFPIKPWLNSCLACPNRICLGDLTHLLCFSSAQSLVSLLCHIFFLSWCDLTLISNCILLGNPQEQKMEMMESPFY